MSFLENGQTPLDRSVIRDAFEDATSNCAGPAVSVAMPVRNGERYVEEAVRSILEQTLSAIELIVVDDGSSDKTWKILQKLATLDPRMRVAHNPGAGLIAALNHALSLCRAPLIARMDADDISRPDRLRRQLEEFDARPNLVLLGTQMSRVDAAGKPLGEARYPIGDRHCRWHQRLASAFAHPTVMYRADSVRLVGGYRDTFKHAEDFDLWLRLSEIGEIDNIQESLLEYRIHGNNVTSVHAREQAARTALALVFSHARMLGLPEPEASSGVKDLADIHAICERRPNLMEVAEFAYWRALSLNTRLNDDEAAARLLEALPHLSAIARRREFRSQFAFMMIRAAYYASQQGSTGLAIDCVLRSLAAAPLATILQVLSHVRIRNAKCKP